MESIYKVGDKVIFKGYNGKYYKHCKITEVIETENKIEYKIKGTRTIYDTLCYTEDRFLKKGK